MKKNDSFKELVEVMDKLRGEGGCPWDKEQTAESLKIYLLEEAYEVISAINKGNNENLKEELGDLLLQVIFQARIAKEKGFFDIYEVAENIKNKLIERHPHVFGSLKLGSAKEVLKNWENFKKVEGKALLDGVPPEIPSLIMAYRVSEKVARVGFDWEKIEEIFEKLKEEVEELGTSLEEKNEKGIEEEIGDILFTVVNICRFFHINPEEALKKMVHRFVERFSELEKQLKTEGKEFQIASLQEMNEIWERVKK